MYSYKEGNEPVFETKTLLNFLFSIESSNLTISEKLLGHYGSIFPFAKWADNFTVYLCATADNMMEVWTSDEMSL